MRALETFYEAATSCLALVMQYSTYCTSNTWVYIRVSCTHLGLATIWKATLISLITVARVFF